MMSVVMLSIIMLSIAISCIMLSIIMLGIAISCIMLSVIKLSVVKLSVVKLSVVKLCVVMLSVVAPTAYNEKYILHLKNAFKKRERKRILTKLHLILLVAFVQSEDHDEIWGQSYKTYSSTIKQ